VGAAVRVARISVGDGQMIARKRQHRLCCNLMANGARRAAIE
jgi:hypothetical protein